MRRVHLLTLCCLVLFAGGCAAVKPTTGRGALRFMAGVAQPFGDLDDAGYEDAWVTLSASSVLPVQDHISGGGVIDYGTTRSEYVGTPGGRERGRLDMLAISGLLWVHTTKKDSVDEGIPNLRFGAGPRVAWAWEEDSNVKLLSAGEDDWDFGLGFLAEIAGEVPLGDRFMLSAAVRYAWTSYFEWDVDFSTATAVAGIAIRF